MQEIFVIISVGIIYCFWKTNSAKLQKILSVSYGICAMVFSAYAKLDADIVIAFIVFLSGTVFGLIISECGIAEEVTGLSCVYILYRSPNIYLQSYYLFIYILVSNKRIIPLFILPTKKTWNYSRSFFACKN